MVVETFVDRIEGDVAVLLIRNGTYTVPWPREFLPECAKEGSVIEVSLAVNEPATQRAKLKAQALIDELTGNG